MIFTFVASPRTVVSRPAYLAKPRDESIVRSLGLHHLLHDLVILHHGICDGDEGDGGDQSPGLAAWCRQEQRFLLNL